MASRYQFYLDPGSHAYDKFLKANPEFATKEFQKYVITYNRGDRDSGELGDIAKHEVLRLAHAWEEYLWRFDHNRASQTPL